MTADDFHQAFKAVTIIEAQETLVANKVGLFPHMTEKGRERVSRELNKMAFPNLKPRAMTIEEMARLVNG